MGKAPVGATAFYLSVFGGYVYQDAPDVAGPLSVATLLPQQGAVQDGGFVGLDLGYILAPDVSPFGWESARIETSFSTNIFSDDKTAASALSALIRVDGSGLSFGSPSGAKHERQVYDGSIALKGEIARSAVVDLTGSLEFFVRSSEDKTASFSAAVFTTTTQSANVESQYYGTMLALQPEFRFGEGLSFATDFGIGLYVADGNGKFATGGAFPASASDSQTDVGFRGRLGGALKAALAKRVTASLFGTVNYWSDTAYAVMPQVVGPSAKLGLAALTEAKVGARVTIALGGN